MSFKDDISPSRKRAYNLGLALIIIGALLAASIPLQAILSQIFPRDIWGNGFAEPSARNLLLPLCGVPLVLLGRFMRTIAARGWAGSGTILDPRQARDDLRVPLETEAWQPQRIFDAILWRFSGQYW